VSEYEIVFDGGSKGNPGRGYGSFRWRRVPGGWSDAVRLEFGDNVTNNEAEYRALMAALDALADVCGDPRSASVTVRGDSKLVLNHLRGTWKVRADNLRPLHGSAHASARRYRSVRYVWQRRDESVRLLGH